MYGAGAAFAAANVSTYLRRQRPQVLPLEQGGPVLLDLDLGPISGPPNLGPPARAREMGIFNPSLAPAPAGLCPRCAYVAALRVDPLHQCHDASPLLKPDADTPKGATAANAWFKGTAIAILDSKLQPLGWTWLINAPQHQVSSNLNPSRWFVPVGSADRFLPPWAKAVYDVRVVAMGDQLFVSYVCRRCDFSIAQLQLTAVPAADGGLRELRAWQSGRYSSGERWAQGRNQALFVAAPRPGTREELMVQPWLSIVGSFGAPKFHIERLACGKPAQAKREAGRRTAGFKQCGASPAGARLDLTRAYNEGRGQDPRSSQERFGQLDLVANNSHGELTRAAVGGFRLSTTSNLVRVTHASGDCTLYLGVGHLHRSEGKLNQWLPDRKRTLRRKRKAAIFAAGATPSSTASAANGTNATFMWGFHYTHFFYALEPQAPFHVVATSGEFCLQAAQDAADCEAIQFVSGITLAQGNGGKADASSSSSGNTDRPTLLLSYGVNDCEAKVGRLSVDRVWSMLKLLGRSAVSESCARHL